MSAFFNKSQKWSYDQVRLLLAFLLFGFLWGCESDSDNSQPPIPPPSPYDWSNQQSTTLESLKDIHFVDNNFGWAVGENLVLSTSTRGVPWQRAPIQSSKEPNLINSIFFISRQQGWMAGSVQNDEGGEIFITLQGGAYPVLQQSYDQPLTAIHFLDDQLGWAAGINGKVVHTTNAGSEWNTMADLGVDLYDVHFTTDKKGWASGENGSLFKTTDGVNFSLEDLETDGRLTAIHFTDTLHGWVCGFNNTILRRHLDDNNQIVWSDVSVIQASEVVEWNDIYFVDRFTGWVVGNEGNVYRTTDGGESWDKDHIDTYETLNAIIMLSSTSGWIAGDNGLIFTYTP